MNIIISCVLVLLLSFASSVNQATAANYWSVGIGALTFDDSVDQVKPTQIFGRLGHDFNPYFGIGIDVSASLVEYRLYGLDYGVTASFLYLKGNLPLNRSSNLYIMGGPSHVELTGTLGNVSASAYDNDIGFGFGYEYKFNKFNGMLVDYTQYNDDEGVKVYSVNFGYVGYF